jgi:tRNA-splicing ligase RtcB
MAAVCTTLTANDLPESLKGLRKAIEMRVPVGRASHRTTPAGQLESWAQFGPRYEKLLHDYPILTTKDPASQLGTLGTGNHFIEVCLDETERVWFMLHSGSRGLGNKFGSVFIEQAREDMRVHARVLPDEDLAYFEEGTTHFADYLEAVTLAQEYAAENRRLMMLAVIEAAASTRVIRPFEATVMAVDCHHNYVAREHHFGADVLVTRKGAVRAGKGELGIIPGSMGAKSFIVRGKGNAESFESCSHGAGRVLSRTAARAQFTVADHEAATLGIECRKDAGVLDETPAAYKPIEAVMAAQADLVEVLHTLRQIVCVKG